MNWNWFFLIAVVVTFIGVWLLIKCIPKKSEFPHTAIKLISIVFFSIFLLGIPVFSCIGNIFKIKMYMDSETSPFPLIVSIISAGLLCIVLFLTWKEVQREDKPYIPVLKFILASLFLLWQLNLGIHLRYNLPFTLGYSHYTYGTRYAIANYFGVFHTLKLLVFVIYVILNLLFFVGIFIKGKFKERRPLLFSSTGLLMIMGTFALIYGLMNGTRLIPSNYPHLYDLTIFPLTFTTIIGPVLMIALVLVFLGGISSFFKKELRQNRFPGGVPKKAMITSLAAVLLYVFLFKTLWPFQDPAPAILFRSSQKLINNFPRKLEVIHVASYLEFLVYGKRVVKLLVNKLDDNEASVRQVSADFLEYLGDERAVEPLIKALKDNDKKLRDNAAAALVHIKDPRAVNPMVEFLEKDELRCYGRLISWLWKLGEWGDPRFIVPLLEKLDDRDKELRKSVISALGLFKDVRVVDKLIEQLKTEKVRDVIWQIHYQLYMLTGHGEHHPGENGNSALWWQQWWKQNREEFIKKWSTH